MLYQWYETQRAMLSPFAEFASASSKLYSNPLSPFAHTPMAMRVSAGMDLLHRLAKEYEKPEFDITSADVEGIDVAVQQQVAVDKPFCRLLRFKRFTDNGALLEKMKRQPTVLVVAPLSGHHSTLLRDTVRQLLRDHKVFITDWTDARMVPVAAGPFHLDDYVAYVQEFIRHVGATEVNVISVCQPTVPVLAAISLMASAGEPTPRTMTMMGGPIDARKSPTAVNNLAMNKSHGWFEGNVIYRVPVNYPGAGRRVYPGFLQHAGFVAMNPDRHLTSHYDYFLDLVRGDGDSADSHREFYDEYNAVLDMPAEYYLDTIKTVFQDFALVNGTWEVDGQLVRPQDIATTALLTIEGELDDISGAGQTKAAHDLCTGIPASRRFHYAAIGAGHYGIFAGRRWRETIYPRMREFIAGHQAAVPAPAKKRRPRRGGERGRRRSAVNADTIDAALPQTQCRRCGYPDCRGYAEAIASNDADIDRCPPGGAEGIARLSAITGRPVLPLHPETGTEGPRRLAVIDEASCIGCTLCIDACPVDAIVGAARQMHSVVDAHCTGCELCLPPCPVDCIALVDVGHARTGWAAWSAPQAESARRRYAWHRQRLARRAAESDARLAALAPR